MDYLPSSPRLNPPPLLRERDLRQRTSTWTSRRIHLHRHFSTLSRYCSYCHQHHTDPMTCGAKSAKVTRSFTGLTPSSSFGISQGERPLSYSAYAKVFGRHCNALGHCSAATTPQKGGQGRRRQCAAIPRLHLHTRISSNTCVRECLGMIDGIDLSTIRHRHGPPRWQPYLDQASKGDAAAAAWPTACVAKEAITNSLAVHPTGKRIH